MCNFSEKKKKKKYTKQRIEAKATAHAVNMPHQIYIVEQMNVCRGYNGCRGEQKHNEKCAVSLA